MIMGAICLNDDELAEKLRFFQNCESFCAFFFQNFKSFYFFPRIVSPVVLFFFRILSPFIFFQRIVCPDVGFFPEF